MFKKFFLNSDYSFNVKGDCVFKGEVIVSDSEFMNIEISGKIYSLSKIWLGLISHYKVKLPFNQMEKISFVDCKSKVINLKCGKLMIIKPHILIDNEYRIVPGFPSFVVNSKGKVISLIINKRILKESIGPYGYPQVHVYDPDKNVWRNVSVHLLLARAFIFNNEPSVKFYVNHKNGNKLDYRLKNLEWVTSRENSIHAFSSGLRNDNNHCLVRDILTKEIKTFYSLAEALSYIGLRSKFKNINKNVNGLVIPHLFLNRFEIKDINDKSDWFYNDQNKHEKFIRQRGLIQAKNIETGAIIENDSISELSKKTSVSRDQIVSAIKSSVSKIYNNYIFRIKSNLPWPINSVNVIFHKQRKLLITNINTGEIKLFESSRKMRSFTGIDKRTLKDRLQSKKPYKEWLIEEVK